MTAVDRAARLVVWLWRLTKGWLPQVLATAATGLSIVWGSYGEKLWSDGSWAFGWAAVLLIGSVAAQVFLQRPSYMELSRQKEEAVGHSKEKSAAIDQAFKLLLRKLAEHCDVAENTDRASVYYFHEERFVMLSRWSMHPQYTKPGRKEYPIGQGAIGDAWDGRSIVSTLPATRAGWEQRLESRHGFPVGSTGTLTMHCRSIAALRIDVGDHAVGVLVFESIEPTRATQEALDIASTSLLFATLGELVSAIASLTPRIEEVVQAAAAKPTGTTRNWKSAKDKSEIEV
jgi:hypothetical protein